MPQRVNRLPTVLSGRVNPTLSNWISAGPTQQSDFFGHRVTVRTVDHSPAWRECLWAAVGSCRGRSGRWVLCRLVWSVQVKTCWRFMWNSLNLQMSAGSCEMHSGKHVFNYFLMKPEEWDLYTYCTWTEGSEVKLLLFLFHTEEFGWLGQSVGGAKLRERRRERERKISLYERHVLLLFSSACTCPCPLTCLHPVCKTFILKSSPLPAVM